MVRDCLMRSAPFVVSAVCLALIALSILRSRGTPRPAALGPTPFPQGTTSKGGGRCLGEPHARSHSGPMHIGEDVQEPTPLPTSHALCPEQASALRHPHYCRHPRRCGLQRPGSDVQVLQQELLGNASTPTPRFSNKNSSPSAMTSRHPHCRRHPRALVGNPGQERLGNTSGGGGGLVNT